MKAFYLKDIRKYENPESKELLSMVDITLERRVFFADGSRGIIIGDFVYAPFYHRTSCVVKKDEQNIVLTFVGTSRFGLAVFKLPFAIICEPLHFRHIKIHKDTFLFRVFDDVTMCRGFACYGGKGKLEASDPSTFTPVFDRFAHFIGINNGIFCGELLCTHITELL